MVPVVQLVRMPGCDSGGRGFESLRAPHINRGKRRARKMKPWFSVSAKREDENSLRWIRAITECLTGDTICEANCSESNESLRAPHIFLRLNSGNLFQIFTT